MGFGESSRRDGKNSLWRLNWSDTGKMAVALLAATVVAELVASAPGDTPDVSVIYILTAVVVAATTSGYLYGLLACIIGLIGVNYFFTYPYFTLNFALSGYPVTFASMWIGALITSTLTARIRVRADEAREAEWHIRTLYETNQRLLMAQGQDNILHLGMDSLKKLLDNETVAYAKLPEEEKEMPPREEDRKALQWAFSEMERSGHGTEHVPQARAQYIPVIYQQRILAVLGIYCDRPWSKESESPMNALISQLAMALERQRLSDGQARLSIETEKEKIRSNLLRAISHDLRTPLTGIYGASSAILENGSALDSATHDKLVSEIREDSQWLIRMVENLLSVTRIRDGDTKVNKESEVAEEIVAEAISRIRVRYPRAIIQVKVPEEAFFVPMEGTLIEQVIINLVENAITHGEGSKPVEVSVFRKDPWAVFEISDQGKGISPQHIADLFDGMGELSQRLDGSGRNTGIGLSICKSIIVAHSGKIEWENRPQGGATFRFYLPLQEGEVHE